MEFKIGETCSGCDAIVKGLKKYEGKDKLKQMDIVADNKAKKDIESYMSKAVGESKTVSKKLAGNLKEIKGGVKVDIDDMVGSKGVKSLKQMKYRKRK